MLLAGHDQSGGEVKVKDNGTKVKLFYGMSSATAMEKHRVEWQYRASEGKTCERFPTEGRERNHPGRAGRYQVSLHSTHRAGKLKEMPKRTTFIRVSQQLNEVSVEASPMTRQSEGSVCRWRFSGQFLHHTL